VVSGADADLEADVASSSLPDRTHNEHCISSAETDNQPRANQTEPVVSTDVSDEPPFSIPESSRQTLALTAVSASSLLGLGEGGVDISNFTVVKILGERPSPSGVEYKCKFKPLWLAADLVEKVKMEQVRTRNCKNGLRQRKRKLSQM
jgi:hypothetical protein